MTQGKRQENKTKLRIPFLILGWFVFSLVGETVIIVDNPYEGIVWTGEGAWQRHKANFHTHTTQSDGAMAPDVVIDHYYENGYTILAITDHNRNTWPWTNWNRDPETLGMLAISGNEFSTGHHRGSFFNTIGGDPGSDVKSTLSAVTDAGGLSMLYHPGRYSESIEWYMDIYTSIPTCFGLEVFNQGDRYPNDRATWDAILTQLMPDRPVWGYANDDMHTTSHLFRAYNMVFVEELTEAQVRQTLQSGHSYFSYEPGKTGDALAPSIESITLDTAAMTITISAAAYNNIEWISSGNVVGNGASFSYAQSHHMSYVRARIIGDHGETHTQPFGISSSLDLIASVLTDTGDVWYYLDDGSDQGTAWKETDFDDAVWASGPAKLGYGDGNEATTVSYGDDSNYKHVTTYFRREFTLNGVASIKALYISLLRDDGAVVYLNGIEVHRSNMPDGIITYTTFASTSIGGSAETTYEKAYVNENLITAGKNVVAVEIHQSSRTSSDIGFDMSLTALMADEVTNIYTRVDRQTHHAVEPEVITKTVAKGKILVSVKPYVVIDQLTIVDLKGRTVRTINSPSKAHLVDMSSFSKGFYVMEVYSMGWSVSTMLRVD